MLKENIDLINEILRKFVTYEFQIAEVNYKLLRLVGSQDLFYGHNLEIILQAPLFIKSNISWRVATDHAACFELNGDEDYKFSIKNNILVDYKTIKFQDEDGYFMYFSFEEMKVKVK